MSSPVHVDSEGVISFNESAPTQQEICDDFSGTEAVDVLSDAGSNSGVVTFRKTQHNDNSNDNAVSQISEMVNGMTSMLKNVILELKELKQTQPATQEKQQRGENSVYTVTGANQRDLEAPILANRQYQRYLGDVGMSHNQHHCNNNPVAFDQRHYADRAHDYQRQGSPYQAQRSPWLPTPVTIPAFTGKDDWQTWIARFEAIAHRHRWGNEQKLDHLLPRIEGQASEFVFTQLPPTVLQNYEQFVAELNCRFRTIETTRSFAAKFSSRVQKNGESVEDYAAELKRLYDKAHGYRDRHTRDEDLVRRFLDGLLDDEVRFEVEYHKEPANIDEAVYHVVNLIETRNIARSDRRGRINTRRATAEESHINQNDIQLGSYEQVNRVPEWNTGSSKTDTSKGHRSLNFNRGKDQIDDQSKMLEKLLQRIEKLEKAQFLKGSSNSNRRADKKDIECFNCHKLGHYARNCPEKKEEDLKMMAQGLHRVL